jgi:putative oxidoreductase
MWIAFLSSTIQLPRMRMTFLAKYRDAGLLLLRLSLGLLFVYLCAPGLFGGATRWANFGAPVRHIGLHSHFPFWGFVGALAGSIGGILIIFGLFFRIGLLLTLALSCLHVVAHSRAGLHGILPALETSIVLVSLLFIGPGKFSVDKT